MTSKDIRKHDVVTNLWHLPNFVFCLFVCHQMIFSARVLHPPDVMHKRQIKAIQTRRRRKKTTSYVICDVTLVGRPVSSKPTTCPVISTPAKSRNATTRGTGFTRSAMISAAPKTSVQHPQRTKWKIERPGKKAQNFFRFSSLVFRPIFNRRMLYCTHCFREVGTLL